MRRRDTLLVSMLGLAAVVVWGYVAARLVSLASAPPALPVESAAARPDAPQASAWAPPFRGVGRDPFERPAVERPSSDRPAAPVDTTVPPPPFRLVGIVGRGALVRTPGGATRLLGVGESIAGGRLEQVGDAWVAVRVRGRAVRLHLVPPPGSPRASP